MRRLGRNPATRACATLASAAVLLSGCSLVDDEAVATWDLRKDETHDSATTAFTVDVTRLGCNSGETGTVNDPDIEMTDTEVVITFTVSPGEPSSADCQGNDAVSYDVELPEALGERELVDGGCASADASGTAPCLPSGVRYTP